MKLLLIATCIIAALLLSINYKHRSLIPEVEKQNGYFTKNIIERVIDNDWKYVNPDKPSFTIIDPELFEPSWFVVMDDAETSLLDQFEYKIYIKQKCNLGERYDSGEVESDGSKFIKKYLHCHKGEFLTFTSFSWVEANNNFRKTLGGFEVNFPITEEEVALFKRLETLKRNN